MHLASGESPDEPRVDGAEAQLSLLGTLACTGHVVENPLNLCSAEVGVDNESRLLADYLGEPTLLERVAVLRGAAVLPHDGVITGSSVSTSHTMVVSR